MLHLTLFPVLCFEEFPHHRLSWFAMNRQIPKNINEDLSGLRIMKLS